MPRKAISLVNQSNVLIRARRRCCICFGLNRDTSIKQGQIAHIDKVSSNNNVDNLVFLCFDHHDQYDSTTRQSKNFTQLEIKAFRDELDVAIHLAFDKEIQFGNAAEAIDPIEGHYIRTGVYESAELKIQRLRDGSYHVSGMALWGIHMEYGGNFGELDFIGKLSGCTIEYHEEFTGWNEPYRAEITFTNNGLIVKEENISHNFGANVNFTGEYEKAS